MRPPVPTSDQLPKDEANRQRRAALIPVIVGLVIVLGLAGLSALNRTTQIVITPFRTGDMQSTDSMGIDQDYIEGEPANDFAFMPPRQVDEVLLLRDDDSPLIEEPADLPVPELGSRIAAFERTTGQITDEYAFWKIKDTSVPDILDFYRQAAMALMFQPIKQHKTSAVSASTSTSAPASASASTSVPASSQAESVKAGDNKTNVTTLIFTRTRRPNMDKNTSLPPANDVLIVRVKPASDGQVHVTLWYRHAFHK